MSELLDDVDIRDEGAYQAAMKSLDRQDRPPAILRLLMQAFEAYRQARKIGWSRPWNKYGINTFQSFRLEFPEHNELVRMAKDVLAAECPNLPDEAAIFVSELLKDDDLMGFIFVHEYDEDDWHFEGATLSFGRKSGKRYRDRFDIIVEAQISDGHVGDLSRMRVFIDPYRGVREPLWQTVIDRVNSLAANSLFRELAKLSHAWAGDRNRRWDHWTSRYIDYFGPRRWPGQGSPFYTEGGASPR